MAVRPPHQRLGVGSALIEHGLEECRRDGYDAVVVVGHPAFCQRFGFRPGSRFGLRCQFDLPDEVFLGTELRPGVPAGGGEIRYASEFAEASDE